MLKVNVVPEDENSVRELTYGEKQTGLNFNPSKMPEVDELKALGAAFIDKCNELRGNAVSPEAKRHLSVAITEMKTAQMWAVAGATWSHE